VTRQYRSLVRIRAVRTLIAGSLVSIAGDQLARLALSVVVFQRTHSALFTGLTYATTFLPALIGGPLLAGLADRLPRRRVMVAADVVRIPLIGVLALPWMPWPVAIGLLAVTTVIEAPFDAARAALLPDVAPADYQRALSLDRAVQQSGQVLGFLAGGLVLTVVSPQVALLLDAVTFAVSAALLRFGIPDLPAAADAGPGRPRVRGHALADARLGVRLVFGRSDVRRLVLLVWLVSAIAVVPEGLAVPYAASLGAGGFAVGLLFAANPIGNALAGPLVGCTSVLNRPRRVIPTAALAVVPLIGCLARPPFPIVVVLVAVSGAGMTASLLARAEFVASVPREVLGRAFGVAAAGITVIQGVAVGAAGALTDVLSPAVVVGIAGLVGTVGVAVIAATHPRRQWEFARTAVRAATVSLTMPTAASERA
jgi:MFS transporter